MMREDEWRKPTMEGAYDALRANIVPGGSAAMHSDEIDAIRKIHKSFGKHAKLRREVVGLSQELVALILQTKFGIKWIQTTVAKVEAGSRQVKLNEALALACIYGITVDDLAMGRRLQWTGERRDDDDDLTDGEVEAIDRYLAGDESVIVDLEGEDVERLKRHIKAMEWRRGRVQHGQHQAEG